MQTINKNKPENDKTALISLTTKEQQYRHQQQTKQQKLNNLFYFFGLIFGFLYNVFLLYLIYELVQNGHNLLGLAIFFINAILILGSFAILSFSRKSNNHKPIKHHNKKQHRDQ
jgi:uncharacterized membrane protein